MTGPFEHPVSYILPFLADDLLLQLHDSYISYQKRQPEPSREVAVCVTLVEEELQRRRFSGCFRGW